MKRKKLYIAILLLAGVLTSCKVGKSYVRPDLHLPDSLERAQDSISFGDQDWRDIYTDATLRSLIERALDHNKDMLIAAARVKEMAAQKRISTAALLPDIKGKVTAERELENHGGDAFKRSETFEAQFLVSWELDLWGNLRWARSASIAEYLQSIEAQRALRMTIVAEVAQAYYELVALDTELDIVKQTLKAREEGVRLARIRFAGGLTSETSYRQAQVELARTATLVPDLERKISLKENDIAYLAGEYPNKIARSRLLQEFNSPETLPVGLPSTLLERRPDIRQAEAAIDQEIEHFIKDEITVREVEKIIHKTEARISYSEISYQSKASNLAFFEFLGDVDLINTEGKRYNDITVDKIKTTARELFRKENCSTLWYLKK